MTREEKILEARRLHQVGWTSPEIGRELGVSDSTIRNWYLGGVCEVCGIPTEGSKGHPAPRCHEHNVPPDQTYWTQERIIEAIQDWKFVYGEPPASADWSPHNARLVNDEDRALRAEGLIAARAIPWSTTVIGCFGSWNEAIRAAGFIPRENHGGGANTARRRSERAKVAA
jgi:hypothetical protein